MKELKIIKIISRDEYESFLGDSTLMICEFSDKYGSEWLFHIQATLCAMAVDQCASDADEGCEDYDGAIGLFNLVKEFEYDTIFEDNHLEDYKPEKTVLDSIIFSMCQAETGDYYHFD